MIRVGSLFSGVGGLDLGLANAGFDHQWFAEIDDYSREVLRHHWPGVHVYSDVRNVECHTNEIEVLVGGFPCQDLSVAGKRAGLDGDRSGLFWEFMRVAEEAAPDALVIENVVGMFSSGDPKGADFGVILDALAERGYVVAWRTLNATDFGVPQRRRRVFLVGIRDGHPGADRVGEVLAVGQGSGGNPQTRDEAWSEPPAAVGAGTHGARQHTAAVTKHIATGVDDNFAQAGHLAIMAYPEVAGTLTRRYHKGVNSTMDDGAMVVSYRKSKRARSKDDDETWVEDDATNTLNSFDTGDVRTTQVTVAYNVRPEYGQGADLRVDATDEHPTLCQQTHLPGYDRGVRVQQGMQVRRLSPRECERLMGWPDDWTLVDYKGKPASDTKRYIACGNGVVAPVAEWIGHRLKAVLT